MKIIKAIITTLDNLNILKEQIYILKSETIINEIIVVNNGSIDGTKKWLKTQNDLTIINRKNNGAGPGRNSGLNAAGKCDYFLMLDGGIRPLRNGTKRLFDFLERRQDVDVLGVEIPHFETDESKAWRRWPNKIKDEHTYRNTRLSQTAYCLARYKAFDGFRFCEEGPFGEAAWGADDDLMAYQWNDGEIIVHAVTNVHPYRHGSGSFNRLYQETGVWPNQYGSVYEKRVVWLQHNYPNHQPGIQWGEPWITVVIKQGVIEDTIRMIKFTHDELQKRRLEKPWDQYCNPYSIIVWGNDPDWLRWAENRYLRQHHGNKIVANGIIIERSNKNEELWTGDFRICKENKWIDYIRPNSGYYSMVENIIDLKISLSKYNQVCPRSLNLSHKPTVKRVLLE